jgi:cytochrome c-type biogenesis protein CcmF
MHDIGTALLYVAFLAILATGLTALVGARLRSPALLGAARHGLVASWLLFLAMGACLIYGLVTHDFSNRYIAAYTDRDMPLAYLLAGFWGGEKGALLFWVISLTTFSCLAVLRNRTQTPVFLGYVTAFLSFAIFFFAMLMVFESNPFEIFQAGVGPEDGKGMNPLLQNPLMSIHPPSLLTGYISFTLPFAFGLAALVTGQLDSQWLRDTRKWTLISWLFLSLGLILGGAWAYKELGWGGFWMWDPVENAGLIPWFTATAFLHSVMIQERRNMLKRWNAVLVCLTFLLTIFGTFLTRSQLIDSVHAFADSTLASYFLWYMGIIAVVSALAVGYRWKQLRAEAELDSLLSREAFFVLNNVLLVGCAFVVLWGTVFGQISDAKPVQALYNQVVSLVAHVGVHMEPLQQKVQLGEPWFNRVMTPLGLALLLMTGVGPLISWRRATRKNFEKNFKRPLVVSSLVAVFTGVTWLFTRQEGVQATVDALGSKELYGILCIWFASFVGWTIALEFHIGARARQKVHGSSYPLSLVLLTMRNKRRYGGYIVHLGIVLCFLAFAGNAFRTYQPEIALHPGDRHQVGDYALFFTGQDDRYEDDGAYVATRATVVAMAKEGVVPADKVEVVRKLVGSHAKVDVEPGTPRLSVTFADANEGRRFAARQLVASLRGKVADVHPDPKDAKVLRLVMGPELAQVASVTPQVVMKFFGQLRDDAKTTLPGMEVRTTPGQTAFALAFADVASREQFQRDLGAGPWPGLLYVAVNPHAEVGQGLRVDVVPAGVGSLMEPEVRFYKKHSSPTTEVAIESTILHDLYLAMRPAQGQRFINLLAVVFPFVSFLWLGAIVMLSGAVICVLPTRQAPAVEVDEAQPPKPKANPRDPEPVAPDPPEVLQPAVARTVA